MTREQLVTVIDELISALELNKRVVTTERLVDAKEVLITLQRPEIGAAMRSLMGTLFDDIMRVANHFCDVETKLQTTDLDNSIIKALQNLKKRKLILAAIAAAI